MKIAFIILISAAILQPFSSFAQEKSKLSIATDACLRSIQQGDRLASETACDHIKRDLDSIKAYNAEALNALTAYTSFLATKIVNINDLNNLEKAEKKFKPQQIEDYLAKANANFILGNLYSQLHKHEVAAKKASDAILLFEKAKNITSTVDAIALLSDILLKMGDKVRALSYSSQAHELVLKIRPESVPDYERLKFSANKALSSARLANGLIRDALPPAIDASVYVDRIDPGKRSSLSISIHSYLASLYLLLSDYDSALPHALIATNRIGDDRYPLSADVASGVLSLFQIYHDTEKLNHARNFADRISPIILSSKDSAPKIKILGALGSFYLKTDDQKAKARSLIVSATLISYKMFGPESKITLELAELADAIETEAEKAQNQSLQK